MNPSLRRCLLPVIKVLPVGLSLWIVLCGPRPAGSAPPEGKPEGKPAASAAAATKPAAAAAAKPGPAAAKPGPAACTVESVQQKGELCASCENYLGSDGRCDHAFAEAEPPWEYRCRGAGAKRWTEVWCRAYTGTGRPPVPSLPPLDPPKPSR